MSQTESITRSQWTCDQAERLVRFDEIRMAKLYEIIQNTLFTIPLAFLSSGFILVFLKPYAEDPNKYTVGQLIFTVFVGIIMVVLGAYYIPKIVKVIPPLFPYQGSGYKPSLKGESSVGISFALGVFYFSNLRHLSTIIGNIGDRLYPFAFKI